MDKQAAPIDKDHFERIKALLSSAKGKSLSLAVGDLAGLISTIEIISSEHQRAVAAYSSAQAKLAIAESSAEAQAQIALDWRQRCERATIAMEELIKAEKKSGKKKR